MRSGFYVFRTLRCELCGRSLCVLDRSSSPPGKLIRYDPVTKTEQQMALDIGPPFLAAPGFDVSADGRWVLYVRADSIDSDIMMIENFR